MNNYGKFYEGLVDIFEKLELDFEPRLFVQDGSDSMLNAANNVFTFVLCVKKLKNLCVLEQTP